MADRNISAMRVELEGRRASIDAEVNRITAHIQSAALAGDAVKAKATLEVLLRLCDVRRVIGDALGCLSEETSGSGTPIYTVSAWFLRDCFRYLNATDVEALHHVTGVQFGNWFTLDRMVTFQMSVQTPIYASGDASSTHKAAMEIEANGHKLLGHFHIHPGKGPTATSPSSIDLDYQARLEKGGYAAIGGIFSRDGYFKVFSSERPFSVAVYGKGVQQIDDRLFHLAEIK